MPMPPGIRALKTRKKALNETPLSRLGRVVEPWLCLPGDFGNSARDRLYTPSRVFWLFLGQVLSPDKSCAEVVKGFLAWLALSEGRNASPDTGAYCKARARLPLEEIAEVHAQLVSRMKARAEQSLWCGRRVKVVDGSSLSMPDTAENQAQYPQPSTQKPGCGFPVMRFVAVFSLATGALIDVARDALRVSEHALFRQLWDAFEQKDVILADRGFCSFASFYYLQQRGVDCVMRNHQRRKKGLTEIKKLGKGDRLLMWHKGKIAPKWLTKAQWQALPEELEVREVSFRIDVPGFRATAITLATTLLDPREFFAHSLAELYGKRWLAELYLRDIKITMDMDVLRCMSPDMVHKEFNMFLIAYNLLRALMLDAATAHNADPLRLSFKGACATVRHWAPMLACQAQDTPERMKLEHALLHTIARDKIRTRPNRTEPRTKKRRPKNYQLLTKPRHEFKEVPHRGKPGKA